MPQRKGRRDNIIRNPRRPVITFIKAAFFLIALYLIVQGIVAVCRRSVQSYNIGSAATDYLSGSYTGVILRDETVYRTDTGGVVYYYCSNGARLSNNSLAVVIDPLGRLEENLHEIFYGKELISESGEREIRQAVIEAGQSFDMADFSTAYAAKVQIQSTVFSELLKQGGDDLLKQATGGSGKAIYTDQTGFVLHWMDGYEEKTAESLVSADFDSSLYQKTFASTGKTIEARDFLYKIAADNKFQLVFLLPEDKAVMLQQKKNLTIVTEDGDTLTGAFSITTDADGEQVGVITFSKYGCDYLQDRFLNFSIRDTSVTGYKIPETAIVNKTFYAVDQSYIVQGGENSSYGVIVRSDTGDRFVACTVYYKNADENADDFVIGENSAYIYSDEIGPGTVLTATVTDPETGVSGEQTMEIGVTVNVEGVYQINNAYCIFKPIVRLRNSIDTSYVMISSKARYSLSAYDRIVLNAETVTENEIIIQ